MGQEDLKQARRRFVYEEFFLFQLKMQTLRKMEREKSKGTKKEISLVELQEFTDALPFPLTGAQSRVVDEIMKDMKSPYRMNRLLQGDVGSGKTVVAAIGLYAAKLAHYQGALMVPTEILAEQHFSLYAEMFSHFGMNVELLTSSVKGERRREILVEIRTGRNRYSCWDTCVNSR